MVQFTDPERRLIADLRVLLERYDCQLLVEAASFPLPDGSQREQHAGLLTGPGITLHIDGAIARAVAGDEAPPR
jgi:hypothetical protein